MARRSARLQKRSPTPSSSSRSSWETAQSAASPPPQRLPSVVEGAEPVEAMKPPNPPKRRAGKAAEKKQEPQSQLPQPSSAATPLKTMSSTSMLSAFSARTPTNRTPIKPAGEEMHPALHHPSTAKVLDEARWLGFQALGAQTAPPKATDALGFGQATPSKTLSSTKKMANIFSSPDFKFRFKSPIADLSPKTSQILKDGHAKPSTAGDRALFAADEFTAPVDVSPRKVAVPKGKASRFSDVHMAEFKKMDSIANHPSAFRADPSRFKPFNASLKRSPSKAELDTNEPAARVPNKLKRTQSKMDISEPQTKPPVSKLVATPLKRTQAKTDVAQPNSTLPRVQSTVRLVPPSRDGRPQTSGGDSPAKRFKRTKDDDAASTRPDSKDGLVGTGKHSQIAQPRPISRLMTPSKGPMSRLMTPTKASLLRSQSVKATKSTSMIPSLFRSPSAKALLSPTNIGDTMMEGMREGIRKTSNSLHRVRSILRTPSRKFSDDPQKIASGTHMSPPPVPGITMVMQNVAATAPVQKRVNFTNSTLERDGQDHFGKSPSPVKVRAGSEAPTGAVVYPELQSGVEYPALVLPGSNEDQVRSPSRRLTFGEPTGATATQFSFKSDKAITFGPTSKGTIRMVRKSDASTLIEGKKRKLETPEETSDKENTEPAADETRSAKKIKTVAVEPPKTPSSASKLPRRTPKRGASISKSRLAFLSTPKRSVA